MVDRTDAAAFAAAKPPGVLSAFAFSVLPLAPQFPQGVAFQVRCKSCGHDAFRVLSFPIVAPDPSPYSGIEPGARLDRPPHELQCAACEARAGIFDARTQGYDGVLNGGCAYESGEGEATPSPGEFRVVVEFGYNIELEELQQIADEENVSPSDLFDVITITGKRIGGGEPLELSYECA